MEHEPIVERIIHGLVKKHIAGTTMESALESAKGLGSRNISPSLVFLSSNVVEKAKAKYITTTYSELIRRVARSGVKGSVQLSLEQLGAGIDGDLALDNFSEVASVAHKYGVFLWVDPDTVGHAAISAMAKAGGVGLVVSENDADDYAKYAEGIGAAKLLFKEYVPKGKGSAVKRIDGLRRSYGNIVVSNMNETVLDELVRSRSRAEVMVEFEFGYSERKLAKAMKKGVRAGMIVPFGKDWIKYAMNNAPERYMRFVAGKLLKEDQDDAQIE
ncbi:MAG: hypothetical protein ACYCO0_03660 [Candidatus Micrarchaeaceae archaeon]